MSTAFSLPQQPQFAIGDKVKVDQERAPADWRSDWHGMTLYVVGITPDTCPIRKGFSGWEYWLCERPVPRHLGDVMDGWAEEHLEAA